MELNAPEAFKALLAEALATYYEAAPVIAALGWRVAPPQPHGHDVAANDEATLRSPGQSERRAASSGALKSKHCSSVGDLHQQLAEVPSLEQADQRFRRLLEAMHDVLAVLDLAGLEPAADVAQEVLGLIGEIARRCSRAT